MYTTLTVLLFNVKLFVVCFYLCRFNLIWWWYMPSEWWDIHAE